MNVMPCRPPHFVRGLVVGAGLLLASGCGKPAPSPLPNILLIETDDQRWDTLWTMPLLERRLGRGGVTFSQAVVSNPICCPSRASLLSGGRASHDLPMRGVHPSQCAAATFDDRGTLAVELQRRGYFTGLVGKYLNGYDAIAPRVPPGWSRFVTRIGPPSFRDHRLVKGESTPDVAGQGRFRKIHQYLTDLERDEALAFLDQARASGRPFFLWLTHHAPHRPATPDAGDAASFADFDYRDRAWGEEDLADKPDFVRRGGAGFVAGLGGLKPALGQPGFPAEFPRAQARALQAVDRAVSALLDRLETLPPGRPTVVIFTSDNGLLWGEHRLYRKGMAYEEAIRVPLLVKTLGGLPLAPGPRDALVAVDLDLGATLVELAGLPPRGAGTSLLPLLASANPPWRQEVVLEGFGLRDVPPWVAVRDRRFKYVEYQDGQRELYDLGQDPFELHSRHGRPEERERMEAFANLVTVRREKVFAGPSTVDEP